MADEVLQSVTEADVHELVYAYKQAYVQGQSDLGAIQFRVLQAELNASAQAVRHWIELNASSSKSTVAELDSYIAAIDKGDLVGKSVDTLAPIVLV